MSLQSWQCHSTLASQTACKDLCIKISNSSQPMIHKDDITIMLRCWCTICSWILYCNFQRCSILYKGKCIHRDLHIAGAWALHPTPLEQHSVQVHIVYTDWKEKKLSEKILADFNLNMMHFRKENFVRRVVKVLSSDLVCDRVHKFRAFQNEADNPAPADQTRLDAHYTTRILVVRQQSFHRRHHEVARPFATAADSAPIPKKADSPIPADQIHPDVHYTMQILVVQQQSLRWYEASGLQTPALPSSQPCLPFWLPKLSKLTLKLPTEGWGGGEQKQKKQPQKLTKILLTIRSLQ